MKINTKTIKEFVHEQKAKDRRIKDVYILDEENAIILIENNGDRNIGYYTMIHERLIDGKIHEINRWPMNSYYFGPIHDETLIESLQLFKVQNGRGGFDALYDYKNGKFVVKRGDWNLLDFGYEDKYIRQYGGFIASFSLSSDYEPDDIISYVNPVTNEKIMKDFGVDDGNYYAILGLDGTIIENRLFKGKDFSRIYDKVDLDEYNSLKEFKRIRKEFCNEQKQKLKQEYRQMIEARNDGSISPYLDTEVAKVFQKIKKDK